MAFASIVILTQGNPEKVLKDLERQTFKDFEVIIASETGIVDAMNLALAKATGEIFVRIDDDVHLTESWLYELKKPFSDPMVCGVTGPTFVPEDRRSNRDSIRLWENPGWFLRWLADGKPYAPAKICKCGSVSYGSNYVEHITTPKEIDHLEGTNWAMRTDLIRKVGGFDPAFDGVSEWFDTDVEFKIKKLGYILVYSRWAVVFHLLDFTDHYEDRFDGIGRIKNWIRFHHRHSKFHPKMIVFLFVWILYFIQSKIKRLCPNLPS
jgi:GT2 family glycosyltransferase